MKIWAVANQKGGVGKTTTAVTLAGHLVNQGERVLLVDMDPHGSLTAYFGNDPDTLEESLYLLFQGEGAESHVDPRQLLLDTRFEGLRLLPASTALATLDRQLGSQEGKGLVMARSLARLEGEFDTVLIDCPPTLGILMVNAMAACEHLLLPVQTEFLALKGLERMMRTLQMILRARRGGLSHTIIPTMYDRRTRAAGESLQVLREKYGNEVWNSVIPVDTQFREASKQGIPLSIMRPAARGAQAYAALLHSLLNPGADQPHLKLVTGYEQ
ncbi:MAG: ParA family protein [Thiohalophilus sp.]|uniref:ParA family protein n=1 Tax=Thiohalophilus sp. TaxID=3028392 RepID=UPI00286FD193|nr:ParA family protein [Thiohalophilus sp.]MDR9436645.1 ParA family protein [Thiohalophilus sp.]MDY6980804.1 ParA family protein [Pseudomonadota bacterium]